MEELIVYIVGMPVLKDWLHCDAQSNNEVALMLKTLIDWEGLISRADLYAIMAERIHAVHK